MTFGDFSGLLVNSDVFFFASLFVFVAYLVLLLVTFGSAFDDFWWFLAFSGLMKFGNSRDAWWLQRRLWLSCDEKSYTSYTILWFQVSSCECVRVAFNVGGFGSFGDLFFLLLPLCRLTCKITHLNHWRTSLTHFVDVLLCWRPLLTHFILLTQSVDTFCWQIMLTHVFCLTLLCWLSFTSLTQFFFFTHFVDIFFCWFHFCWFDFGWHVFVDIFLLTHLVDT